MPQNRTAIVPICIILALSVLVSGQAWGQSNAREISKLREGKEKELTKLRAEIQAFEKRLSESEKKEKTTLDHIDYLERQGALMRKLINRLRDQEQQLTGDIQESRSSIKDLEQQLESLTSQYAKYVRSVYKYGRVYDLELLFSSQSVNQLYIRIEYLKRFSEQRAKDLREVVGKKSDLEAQNERLQNNLQHERKLLAEKTGEESSLKKKMTQRQRMLASIRNDKRSYRQELQRRTKAVQ